jgi:hypothetical protein
MESADYSLAVAYSGGYILPGYSGTTDPTNNPTGALTNLPPEIEEAVWSSVLAASRSDQAGRILRKEKTPGGWEQEWDTSVESGSAGLTRYALDLLEPYMRVLA